MMDYPTMRDGGLATDQIGIDPGFKVYRGFAKNLGEHSYSDSPDGHSWLEIAPDDQGDLIVWYTTAGDPVLVGGIWDGDFEFSLEYQATDCWADNDGPEPWVRECLEEAGLIDD